MPFLTGPGIPGLTSTVVIVVDCGEDVQHYAETFADLVVLPPPVCPQCAVAGRLIGHGSYGRTLTDATRAVAIRVKRLLCTACRHTHALLPTFCLPFRHYQTATIQTVLTLRIDGGVSWSALRRRFAPSEVPSPTTCRAWVGAFGHASARYLPRLVQYLAAWTTRSVSLEVAVADLARVPSAAKQLIAAVPHLVAWLGEVGVVVRGGSRSWLATLWQWGDGAKLGRLV